MDDGLKMLLETMNDRLEGIEHSQGEMRKDMTKVREDVAGLKVKAGVAGGIVAFFTSLVIAFIAKLK